MRQCRYRDLGVGTLIVFLLASLPSGLLAADKPAAKRVLVLYSVSQRNAVDDLESMKRATRSHLGVPVDFEVEYLEPARFTNPGYERSVSDSLEGVYRGKVDLVVAVYFPALAFAAAHRDQLFPGVPIEFLDVDADRFSHEPGIPNVTGYTTHADVAGTIDLGLRLFPQTANVAVLVDTTPLGKYWGPKFDRDLAAHHAQLHVIDLVGLSSAELLERVAKLPPRTIVIFFIVPQESQHEALGTYELLSSISKQFPTFCMHPYCLNHGAVGGSFDDSGESGTHGGLLAARLLAGEKADSIPVTLGTLSKPQMDWRELQHWNIPESALPPGTIVWYKQPTLWERYKKYFLAVAAILALQTLLIAVLLVQRRRTRIASLQLRESEKRFRLMADTTPALIWMCDKEGRVTYLNERRLEFTGSDATAGFGDSWTGFVHPDDLGAVLRATEEALSSHKPFSREYRLRRHDGSYRWMLDVAAPRANADGSFIGLIGSATDITDQKMARSALEGIGGKLIEAQEEERTRIARELHDDICQRLALLSIELDAVTHDGEKSETSFNRALEKIQHRCVEITQDVQSLSHKLHSSKLEYLGLVAALQSFCNEFSEQMHVHVDFTHDHVPRQLPHEVSLTLFRVTQESLQNALKYSGTTHFAVQLQGASDGIHLKVIDHGSGFDVENARGVNGLGLISMQERANLVRGTFSIESTPQLGTRISLHIPLVAVIPGMEDEEDLAYEQVKNGEHAKLS
jgi:PAS domain S-box-containing protein